MSDPLISIVITTKNEEKNIENCLRSVKAQNYPNIEIIVVDNNSTDRTKEISRQYTPNVFDFGPERSAQRNYGLIQKAKGEYELFLDADMILPPDLIKNCVDFISQGGYIALHISEIVLGKNFFSRVRRFERSFYDGTVIDGSRFFRRDAFIQAGGFDETMSGPEDWDLDKKLKKIGAIGLIPAGGNQSVIYHNEAEFDLKKYLSKKGYYAKSFAAYINKWGKNDPDIKKQFGLWYRYFGVFLENGKWKKILAHPTLVAGMYFLRGLVGIVYLFKKDVVKNGINEKELLCLSKEVRKNIWKMVYSAKSSHVGSAFSIVEILVSLYKFALQNNNKNQNDPERDRLILSKGHACSALYSILAEMDYFDKELLEEYSKNDSVLMSHVNSEVPGVEFSTGSLGHGLPVALGLALAAKKNKENWRAFVIMSDGELNEGSNWEAFAMAAHLKANNLFVVVDCNKLQALGFTKDIVDTEPLEDKFKSFDWEVARVDGHNLLELQKTFKTLLNSKSEKPKIIIADTVKGRGISFIENRVEWHYRWPSREEYEEGLLELELK